MTSKLNPRNVGPRVKIFTMAVYIAYPMSHNIPNKHEKTLKINICKTSAQRLRRWSKIVKMLYKCFVLAGLLFN